MRDLRSFHPAGQTLRCVFAAAFLLFLLVEWGSHSLAFSHTERGAAGGVAAQSSETTHDDPCKTLVRCTDGRQQDRPNFRFDNQHNTFLNGLPELRLVAFVVNPPAVGRERVAKLSRAADPPFHPPEIS